ncbi:MAG: hypothetical protein KBF71_03475 [Alphaproteobacteria bacterium]|nr:hypothetical protein [Alphaproteobacteria bacterium]
MSGIHHTPQLESNTQTSKLSDETLGKFHAFSVTTPTDHQATLRAVGHLKKIDLEENRDITVAALSALEAGSLPELETLSLDERRLTIQTLQACLKAAPHLKELSLTAYYTGFEFKALTRLFKNAPLVSLEKLVFDNSQIDMSQDLQAFLEIAPNLKSISILCASNVNGDFTYLQPNSLPNLRRFCVFGPEFTMKDLQSVLLAAPNLKQLNILEYTENGAEKFPPLNLSLEKVYLQGHITNYLQALLRAAPHIKDIELQDDKIDLESALSALNIDSLPALTNFSLTRRDLTSEDYRPITTTDILSVLKMSPNLREIKFEKSLEYADTMTEPDKDTKESETLDFSEFSNYRFPSITRITLSNIDVKNLQNLEEAMPNLEFIDHTPAPTQVIDPEDTNEESLINEA